MTPLRLLLASWLFPALLASAPTAQQWRTHFRAQPVLADFERRLVWQDDAQAESLTLTYDAAQAHCRALRLAGERGWRLPDMAELQRLVGDKARLRHVNGGSYWTSTPVPVDGNTFYGGVRFRNGSSGHTSPESSLHVRCVASVTSITVPKAPEPVVEDAAAKQEALKQEAAAREAAKKAAALAALEAEQAAAEAVARKRRQEAAARAEAIAAAQKAKQEARRKIEASALIDGDLVWQDMTANMQRVRWKAAKAACDALTVGALQQWRLPTTAELAGLYARRDALRHWVNRFYWAGIEDKRLAEYVDFENGESFKTYKTRKNAYRCVHSATALP